MRLNEKQIINLKNLKRIQKLNETKNEDDKNIKVINCENYEDIIDTIHYMLNILYRDLLIEDVVDNVIYFEEVFKASAKKD